MISILPTVSAPSTEDEHGITFSITVDTTGLGPSVVQSDTTLVIQKLPAILQRWNIDNPKKKVRPGDLILAVNDVARAGRLLLGEIEKNTTAQLVIRHVNGELALQRRVAFGERSNDVTVTIQESEEDGKSVVLTVKRTSPLRVLMLAASTRLGRDFEACRFSLWGLDLNEKDTAEALGVGESCRIYVRTVQYKRYADTTGAKISYQSQGVAEAASTRATFKAPTVALADCDLEFVCPECGFACRLSSRMPQDAGQRCHRDQCDWNGYPEIRYRDGFRQEKAPIPHQIVYDPSPEYRKCQVQTTSGQMVEADYSEQHVEAPLRGMLFVVSQMQRERLFQGFLCYSLFCATFILIVTLARPVNRIFDIHSGLRKELFSESPPGSLYWNADGLSGTFEEVVDWPGFYDWADGVLLNKIWSGGPVFHADALWVTNATAATAQPVGPSSTLTRQAGSGAFVRANSSTTSIGKYNQVTTAIRFRQVRVLPTLQRCERSPIDGTFPSVFEQVCTMEPASVVKSCNTPVQSHELSRPCWGTWSADQQDVEYPSQFQQQTAEASRNPERPERDIHCLDNCEKYIVGGLRTSKQWPAFERASVVDWCANFEQFSADSATALAQCKAACDVSRSDFAGGLSDSGGFCGNSAGKPALLITQHPDGCWGDVVDIPLRNLSTAQQLVEAMRRERWAGEGTRMVVVEVNTYNANYDIATAIRASIIVHPGGRLEPTVEMWSCRLALMGTFADNVRMALEVAFVLWLCYYINIEVWELYKDWQAYLCDAWNIVELLNLAIYFYTMTTWVVYTQSGTSELSSFRSRTPEQYRDLTVLAQGFNSVSLASFNLVYGFVRFTKYFRMNIKFKMIWDSLAASMRGVVPGLLAYLLLVVGFTISGHWLFGHGVERFSTFPKAFISVMLSVRDGIDFARIEQVAPTASYFWYASWHVLSSMLLASFTVAVVISTFTEVKQQSAKHHEAERQGRGLGVSLPPIWKSSLSNICPMGLIRQIGGSDKADGEKRDKLAEMQECLNEVDMEELWARLLQGAAEDELAVDSSELAYLFHGNSKAARSWINRVCVLADIPKVQVPDLRSSLDIISELKESFDKLASNVSSLSDTAVRSLPQLRMGTPSASASGHVKAAAFLAGVGGGADQKRWLLDSEVQPGDTHTESILGWWMNESGLPGSESPMPGPNPLSPRSESRRREANTVWKGKGGLKPPMPGQLRIAAAALRQFKQKGVTDEVEGGDLTRRPDIGRYATGPPLRRE